MKLLMCAVAVIAVMSVAASAAEPGNVSISAGDQMLSVIAANMEKQAGVSIIVDPKCDTKLNLSLAETELPKALDVITKLTKLTWKKVQFAKVTDGKVQLDKIKSSIVALAAMPMVAVSVADGSGKGATVFARAEQGEPDTSTIKLPEGYEWTTAYVVYDPDKLVDKPAEAAKAEDPKPVVDKQTAAKMNSKRLEELARMSPDQRKQAYAAEMADMMTLTPDARRMFMQEQFDAAKSMDPKLRSQYFSDMRTAMRSAGVSFSTGGGRNNRPTQTRSRNTVIPAR